VPSAGYGSYCALLSTGGIDCWGYNDYGQVGNGTTDGPDGEYGYDTTQEVGHLTRAISMSGSNDNSCAVLSTGAAKCWGDNQYGELGNGTTGGPDGAYGYDTPHSVSAA
jgi:alpha-tubulin suppressor-like RCC1 family protein